MWNQIMQMHVPLFPLILVLVAYVALSWLMDLSSRKGSTEMDTFESPRRLRELQAVADAITSGFEDAINEGTLTRKEVKYWYRMLGNAFGLTDLKKRRNTPRWVPSAARVKHKIQDRRTNGYNKPAKLPDVKTPKLGILGDLSKA